MHDGTGIVPLNEDMEQYSIVFYSEDESTVLLTTSATFGPQSPVSWGADAPGVSTATAAVLAAAVANGHLKVKVSQVSAIVGEGFSNIETVKVS
jgi:hypothetical protein